MIRIEEPNFTAILYESFTEPGSAGINSEHNRGHRNGSLNASDIEQPMSRWLGADSRDEFEQRLLRGWGAGADRLREISTKEIAPTNVRRRRSRGDQGDELDIHAVNRGDLSRAWTRTTRQTRTATRSVSIVCNLSCSFKQKAADLFWRGAAALKLAEALTQAGYSVALYGATGTRGADGRALNIGQFIEIKAEDAPLDVSALAAIVAMPGFKRTRLHAGTSEECDRRNRSVCTSLGYPSTDAVIKAAKMLPIPQTAFIQPEVNTLQEAQDWVDDTLFRIEHPEEFSA